MSTVTYVGATVVTGVDAAESGPSPTALTAFTVNVYDVPFARPVTMHGMANPQSNVVDGPEEGITVTRYFVIGDPPSDDGAVHVSDT
jgi:hypothetical protein